MSRHKKGGFSITELVIVIAIIGIIGTLGFVFLNTLNKSETAQDDTSDSTSVETVNTIDSTKDLDTVTRQLEGLNFDDSADRSVLTSETSAF